MDEKKQCKQCLSFEMKLEDTQELHNFLTGGDLKGCRIGKNHKPNLDNKTAYTIIWALQEHFGIMPDNHRMCHVCSNIFDSDSEGDIIDAIGYEKEHYKEIYPEYRHIFDKGDWHGEYCGLYCLNQGALKQEKEQKVNE